MDNLKCNRLTCRKSLAEKAVVTTCSHIFCVECANELFNASRLCPACDTSLTEPDDVVVCSLHPSNDYKTSVLSGLNPTIILEICGRAMSFWQYQLHQEHSFQQAVIRSVNEKNAHMQKELHNVVREANGELSILNNKVAELERELELERRKAMGLQDAVKEREKEYQKLKTQYDKLKRKAILNPGALGQENVVPGTNRPSSLEEQNINRPRPGLGMSSLDVGAVVGGMEANGVQRTPVVNRMMHSVPPGWRPMPNANMQARHQPQRQPFNATADHSFRSNLTLSESDSANEVENLVGSRPPRFSGSSSMWGAPRSLPGHGIPRGLPPGSVKRSGMFRPAGMST